MSMPKTKEEIIYRDLRMYLPRKQKARKELAELMSSILITLFAVLLLSLMFYVSMKVDAKNHHTTAIFERR